MNFKTLLTPTTLITVLFAQATTLQKSELPKQLFRKDTLKIDSKKIEVRHFSNLKEKYNDTYFVYERNTNSLGWWDRFKRAIVEFIQSIFEITNQNKASEIFDISVNIACGIIVLLVIYFIYKAIVNKEGRWIFSKNKGNGNLVTALGVEENLNTTNFEALIKEAGNNNNYRLSVRFYYLWLLKALNEKEIIEFDPEKTNSDYILELSATAYSKKFGYTSYLYNYIWYGEFDVTSTDFFQAEEAFKELLKEINNV